MKKFVKRCAVLRFLLGPLIALRRLFLVRTGGAFRKLFCNVVGGTLLLELDNIPGVFEIDARSHLTQRILEYKSYESEITDAIEEQIDCERDAIDVGANVGLLTCFMASKLGLDNKVFCVEPLPNIASVLERNVERNNLSHKVLIHRGLVSDSVGRVTMNYIPGMEEYSSINPIVHESVGSVESQALEVDSCLLDDLVKAEGLNPGLIKIDTEGAELKVLTGSLVTLRKHRPVIICELSDRLLRSGGASAQQVVDLLCAEGYVILDISTMGAVRAAGFHGDILALPLERDK